MSDKGMNAHKQMAESGSYPGLGTVGSGPTLASTAGQKYGNMASVEMPDGKRGHPGRGGKTKPSSPSDVDHGHKWGK